MKIKNMFFTIVAMICLIVSSLFIFTACGKDKHSFAKGWSSNEEYHWHACTKSGCEEVSEKGKHVYDGSNDLICNVCEYEREPKQNQIIVNSKITKTYNGFKQGLVVGEDFSVKYGSASVSYKLKGSDENFSEDYPKNAGTYLARIVVPASSSYPAVSKQIEYEIEKFDINTALGEEPSVPYNGSTGHRVCVFPVGTKMSSENIYVSFTFESEKVNSSSTGATLTTENTDKSILNNYKFDETKIHARICQRLVRLGSGTQDRRLDVTGLHNTLEGGFSLIALDSNFGVIAGEEVYLSVEKTHDWASDSKIKIVSEQSEYSFRENEVATLVGKDAGNYMLCETASITYTKLETAFSSYFSGFEDYAFGTDKDRIVYGEKSFVVSKSEGKNWFELLSGENSSKEVEIRVWCGSTLIATIHRTGTAGNYTYTGGSFNEETGVSVFNLSENISGYTDEQGRWICETKSVTLSLQLYFVEG